MTDKTPSEIAVIKEAIRHWEAMCGIMERNAIANGKAARVNPNGKLSSREKALLSMLADGRRLYEIRNQLGYTSNILGNRMTLIKRKLNAETNMHAVAIALREGLIK